MKYCESIFKKKRFKTREVLVGKVGVGGDNPVRIQSMTTSATHDVDGTLEQIIRLQEAGCEIVRVTVQGMKEAKACEVIKNKLDQKGIDVPLVADIHFYPKAALFVADFVDKVRINPGNFVDKRATFQVIEYTENTYAEALMRLEEKFSPLVEKCKRLKKSIRIGTNHGSLSDRVMNRFGDSPEGMVASAFEFTEVCRKLDFHDVIFSMKASNPVIMIEAYRQLVARQKEKGWNYPLHLGVTEAGDGIEGRIKSAMGIGALLLDGIGDTVRVSLTEDPWEEIAPCKEIIAFAQTYKGVEPFEELHRFTPRKVPSFPHRDGSVVLKGLGGACDGCYVEKVPALRESNTLFFSEIPTDQGVTVYRLSEGVSGQGPYAIWVDQETWEPLLALKPVVLIYNVQPFQKGRKFIEWLKEHRVEVPVIFHVKYNREDFIIPAACELGALLSDKLGEGVFLEAPGDNQVLSQIAYTILQSARMRSVKTEFISCPGCGRTLFDLQEVTKQIKLRTEHLPGVKIAIMGCIVNGPGEMADADFGYVGSSVGRIDLYVGKEKVEKNIPFAEAEERLVALIKAHDRWVEPIP